MKIEQLIRENLDSFNKNEASRYTENFLFRLGRIIISPLIGASNIVKNISRNPPKFKNIQEVLIFIFVFVVLIYVFYAFGSFLLLLIIPLLFTYPQLALSLQNPFIIAPCIYVGSIIFGILFTWQDHHGLRKEIIKRHLQKSHGTLHFEEEIILQSAEILKEFKPTTYKKAVERYGELPVDLLVIAQCIGKSSKSNQLRKIVSLRAVEQDREATAEDDVEEEKKDLLP